MNNDIIKQLYSEASLLAECEVNVRLLFEAKKTALKNLPPKRWLGPKKSEKPLFEKSELISKAFNEWEEKRVVSLSKVNQIRSSASEFKNRKFWWDVPFDLESPIEKKENSYNFKKGFFLQMTPFHLQISTDMAYFCVHESQEPVSVILNLEKAPERHGVLYIDREFLINNPDKNVSIDYIVNFDNVKTFKKCLTEFVGENGIYIPQNEFEVSKETIDDMLQNFNDRQDRFERWLNTYDGVFNMTDEEAALSGKKSKEEYYQSALYRSMGEANIYAKIKKQNEALHLEYLAYQLDRKEAHKAKKAEILQNLQAGDNIINAAVFGHIAMCDEKIVAIWFNNTPVSFFEMKLDDYIDVDSLSNGATPLLFYREIMEKIPNSIAFINFAAEAFSKYLPLHNVLEDKPSGCSDLEWRAWSEARIKAQNR